MKKNLEQSLKDKISYYTAKLLELKGIYTWDSLKDIKGVTITGLPIDTTDTISAINKMSFKENYPDTFSSLTLSKSALAMAKISQLFTIFGGIIPYSEWTKNSIKYIICREGNSIKFKQVTSEYYFLAFRSSDDRELFYKNNLPLIKDYLCMN